MIRTLLKMFVKILITICICCKLENSCPKAYFKTANFQHKAGSVLRLSRILIELVTAPPNLFYVCLFGIDVIMKLRGISKNVSQFTLEG